MNMPPPAPADFDYDAALAELQGKIRRKRKAQHLVAHFEQETVRLTSVMEDRKAEYEAEQEETEKAAIIRDSKELKEAMESGQYVLKVSQSVEEALHTLYTYQAGAYRRNRHHSVYRDHDISLEIRNSRVRKEVAGREIDERIRAMVPDGS